MVVNFDLLFVFENIFYLILTTVCGIQSISLESMSKIAQMLAKVSRAGILSPFI